MCTAIAEKAPIEGAAKGAGGWFGLNQLYLAYDHPFHVDLEHALCVSFVREAADTTTRVAVELPRQAARDLAHRILAALDRAEDCEAR
ncbi:MAG: hypothetical protein GEU74_06075 [Nitriliruptorales bacterium]|nr:hypothetical protein [Nitriliruptorales bacterium]